MTAPLSGKHEDGTTPLASATVGESKSPEKDDETEVYAFIDEISGMLVAL